MLLVDDMVDSKWTFYGDGGFVASGREWFGLSHLLLRYTFFGR